MSGTKGRSGGARQNAGRLQRRFLLSREASEQLAIITAHKRGVQSDIRAEGLLEQWIHNEWQEVDTHYQSAATMQQEQVAYTPEIEEKDMVTKSTWIGSEGRLFERVRLVFEGLSYAPPTTDTDNESGAYAMNIVDQYRADFTEEEILQIIDYARHNTIENLRAHKEYGALTREDVFSERT